MARSSRPAALIPRLAGVSVLLWGLLALFGVLAVIGWIVLMVPSLSTTWTDQSLRSTFLPPFSEGYLLGTDDLGRDFAWRLIAGIGVSVFAVGVLVAVISVLLGLVIGIFAGYFGRCCGPPAPMWSSMSPGPFRRSCWPSCWPGSSAPGWKPSSSPSR
jgi:ABC-type dipeptide/oligopeptide/nickel transport system permease subunit